MKINNTEVKTDCRHFKGYIPCKPHKVHNVKCDNCNYYDRIEKNILIIKLGAIGDVIRTTTLLHKVWEENPNAQIWWLTYSPDVIPEKVDKVLNFNLENILTLQSIDFDLVINLDKDYEACALTSKINSKEINGFTLKDGVPSPANKNAEHKFLTGIFDDLNKNNTKSYPEEIYEICGWKYEKQEYIMDFQDYQWDIPKNKKIIGLNTGCGARWISRLWSEENWIALSKKLIDNDYYPLLLGGEQEHEKNLRIAEITGADYLGHFSLKKFISLMNQCDVVVSAVTMAMHIAIAQKKNLVLLNNIFNKNEFELFGRGEIVEPDKECTCFFSQKCENESYFCMEHLPVDKLFNAIVRQLS